MGSLSFPLGEWVKFFTEDKSYLHFSVYTTDLADVGVLEEPHKFLSHLCHYLSLNILSWVTHFSRGININVQLLLAQSYQSYVFSRVFFLSLICLLSSDIIVILSIISSEHTSFKKSFL